MGSPHILSREERKEFQLFEFRPKESPSYHMDPSLPLNLVIFPTQLSPTDIMVQEDKPLEWICLHHQSHKILTAYFPLLT